MGHFHTTIKGRGADRSEAESNAIDDFLREQGNRHSVRDVTKPRLIGKVPPMGVITKRGRDTYHDYTKPNVDAPKDQWLEEWEFELHTHA
jgi:hypothetical protein